VKRLRSQKHGIAGRGCIQLLQVTILPPDILVPPVTQDPGTGRCAGGAQGDPVQAFGQCVGLAVDALEGLCVQLEMDVGVNQAREHCASAEVNALRPGGGQGLYVLVLAAGQDAMVCDCDGRHNPEAWVERADAPVVQDEVWPKDVHLAA